MLFLEDWELDWELDNKSPSSSPHYNNFISSAFYWYFCHDAAIAGTARAWGG
jgi:hypothetical protein